MTIEDTATPTTEPTAVRPTVWPRPERAATSVVFWSASLAGLAAAITVPLDRPGLGWLLAGLALASLTTLVARRVDGRLTVSGVLWLVAAVALLGIGTLRASDQLFHQCLLAAALAGSLAVAGGRTARGLFLGAIAVPTLAVGGLPWAARGVVEQGRREGGALLRIAGSVLASAALLVVFGVLLAGADAEFARLLPTIDVPTALRWILLFGTAAAAMVGVSYLLSAPTDADAPGEGANRRPHWFGWAASIVVVALVVCLTVGLGLLVVPLAFFSILVLLLGLGLAHLIGLARPASRGRLTLRRIEWALPVGVLVALFGVFVAVQLRTLFGGDDHVLRTPGLTYAEYARSGFWQLLVVTLLTLVVIMTTARHARSDSMADRAWLRGLLGALAVLTLVIVVSALSRMWAYQQAYGFTETRLLVFAFELWLGVVYLLILIAGYRIRVGWLARAVAGTGVVALLALGLLNPDRFIAEQNVHRWQQTGKIDLHYLSTLSADAASALMLLPEPQRRCALAPIASRLAAEPDDWRGWNLGRDTARSLTATLARDSCPG